MRGVSSNSKGSIRKKCSVYKYIHPDYPPYSHRLQMLGPPCSPPMSFGSLMDVFRQITEESENVYNFALPHQGDGISKVRMMSLRFSPLPIQKPWTVTSGLGRSQCSIAMTVWTRLNTLRARQKVQECTDTSVESGK